MSRKIDALVAEKVMGYRWYRHRALTHEVVLARPSAYFEDGTLWDRCADSRQNDERDTGNAGLYSTSIAAAWDVVEKMRIDGWNFSMLGEAPRTPPRTSIPSDKDPKNRFRFHNLMHQPPKDPDGADEATMPLAICVASLRALGVPDVEILAAMAKSEGRAEE